MQTAGRTSDLANRTDLRGKGKGRRGISKSLAYLARVFCVEYDAKHMIDAYGLEFMHYLLDEIAAGRVDCRQSVERWSAHKAISSEPFAAVKHEYDHNAQDTPV